MFHQEDRSSLEAAAEAAAKVNAMLIAKGMLKVKPEQLNGANVITKKVGGPNSLVVAEVEINNLTPSCRNTLTKGQTQEEISKASGASVTTKGRYIPPEQKPRNHRDRNLYLNVQASTKESVDIAVQKINEIIRSMKGNKDDTRGWGRGHRHQYRSPPVSPPRGSAARHQPPRPLMSLPTPTNPPLQMPLPTVTILQEKLYVGLEHAPPNFDTKNKLLGPEGSYLQHIQYETGASVSLRGKASGFPDMPPEEHFEPMHVHIEHQTLEGLQSAKKLAENLIQTVQHSYVSFQQALAALPASVPTDIITGVRQQPQFIEQHLVPPPMTHVPDQLQQLQPQVHQLGPPPMMLPPGSVANTLPPQLQGIQNPAAAPQMVIPSSLAPTQLPLVSTLPVSAPSMLIHQPAGSIEQAGGQPQLILSQQPGAQAGVHQIVQQAQQPGVYTNVQPTLQLVSQPVMSVMQAGQQPPPPAPTPLQIIGAPPQHPQQAQPSSVVYTVASSSTALPYYSSPKLDELPKRRFTEEKDEGLPDNLLGYQHGPPHLVNLVQSSPPPAGSQAPPPPVILQDHPQFAHLNGGQGPPPPPHFQLHGGQGLLGPAPVQPMDMRLEVPPAVSVSALMPPPPPPSVLSSQAGGQEDDRAMMPPPESPEGSWESRKRDNSSSSFLEPDKKKIRGILKNKNNTPADSDNADSESVEQERDHTMAGSSPGEGAGRDNTPQSQHPASPQYQGQPLRYPNHPSDPNVPPTSVHEQHQLRHHLVAQQPELGHLLHLEGQPRPEGPPPTQMMLEHPGLQLAQPGHPHQLRPVLLEHPEHAHLGPPPPTSQELLEIEMQQQQVQQPAPQFHPLAVSQQSSLEQHILAPGSAAITSNCQAFPPQYTAAISSAIPPPPQSYALATSAGVPLVPPPPQHILAAGAPPPPPASSYSLVHAPPPPVSLAYSLGAHPPPPPTSTQYQQQAPQSYLQPQPAAAPVYQPGQPVVSSQYQPTQYWLPPQ